MNVNVLGSGGCGSQSIRGGGSQDYDSVIIEDQDGE